MEQKRYPLGIIILGGLNCFVLGFLALFLFFFVYINLSPETWQTFQDLIAQKNLGIEITLQQLKAALLVQMLFSVTFAVTGLGIFLKKEWARKGTLIFSALLVGTSFLAALVNASIIKQALVQALYPGILVIYFTNKKVEAFFKGKA